MIHPSRLSLAICCLLVGREVLLGQATQPIELLRKPKDTKVFFEFLRPSDQAPAPDRGSVHIPVERHILIEGYFYNFGRRDPVAILVRFKNRPETLNLTYLVRILDPAEQNLGQAFPVLGPQFYEGHKDWEMEVKLVLLKSETVARLRSQFNRLFGPAVTLLPVLGQAASYANTAWELFQELGGKTKVEVMGTVQIPRLPDSAATYESWHILGTDRSLKPLQNLGRLDGQLIGQRWRPALPGNFKGKDRLLLVAIEQSSPTTPYGDVIDRIRQLYNLQADRLKRAGLDLSDPFSTQGLRAESNVRRIFNALLAQLEVQEGKGTDARGPVTDLITELDRGQTLGNGESVHVKLDAVNEQRVCSALTRFFQYKIDKTEQPVEGQGFTSVLMWHNWLNSRDAESSIEWQKDRVNPPYGIATIKYARKQFEALQPPSGKLDFEATKNAVKKLRGLLLVFRPPPDDPWMLFEQKAVATWVRENFDPGLTPPTSGRDLQPFADAFEQRLNLCRVLVKAQEKWTCPDIVPYVIENLRTALTEIANSDGMIRDKHTELRDAFVNHVSKAMAHLTAEERDRLLQDLDKLFPTDTVTRQRFSEIGFPHFFSDNLLTVDSTGAITVTPPARQLVTTIRYLTPFYRSPEIIPPVVRQELLSGVPLRNISASYIAGSGLELSIRRRASSFILEWVPSLAERPELRTLPNSPEEARRWHAEALTALRRLVWADSLLRFIPAGDEDLDEILSIEKSFELARSETEPAEGIKNLGRLLALRRDYQKPEGVRQRALEILRRFVEFPADLHAMDDTSMRPWEAFMERSPYWSRGKYRARN